MSRPKIIYANESGTKFSDIEVGETFVCGKYLFMKIRGIEDKDGWCYNAIVLSDGSLTCFSDVDVTPIDVEIREVPSREKSSYLQ